MDRIDFSKMDQSTLVLCNNLQQQTIKTLELVVESLQDKNTQLQHENAKHQLRAQRAEQVIEDIRMYLRPHLDTGDSRTAAGWAVGIGLLLPHANNERCAMDTMGAAPTEGIAQCLTPCDDCVGECQGKEHAA